MEEESDVTSGGKSSKLSLCKVLCKCFALVKYFQLMQVILSEFVIPSMLIESTAVNVNLSP